MAKEMVEEEVLDDYHAKEDVFEKYHAEEDVLDKYHAKQTCRFLDDCTMFSSCLNEPRPRAQAEVVEAVGLFREPSEAAEAFKDTIFGHCPVVRFRDVTLTKISSRASPRAVDGYVSAILQTSSYYEVFSSGGDDNGPDISS